MIVSAKLWSYRLAMVAAFGVWGFFAAIGPAYSADVGNAHKGFEYAKSICAQCHAIEAGQKQSPVSAATPFEVFANTPGVNRTALLVFLQTPHPTMPNLIVAGEDADDVIAYMLSLKKAN